MVIRYDDCGAAVVMVEVQDPNQMARVSAALGGEWECWRNGTLYNYGVGDAHYPVPAIPYETIVWLAAGHAQAIELIERDPEFFFGRMSMQWSAPELCAAPIDIGLNLGPATISGYKW